MATPSTRAPNHRATRPARAFRVGQALRLWICLLLPLSVAGCTPAEGWRPPGGGGPAPEGSLTSTTWRVGMFVPITAWTSRGLLVWVAGRGGAAHSPDGGKTWSVHSTGLDTVDSLAVSPEGDRACAGAKSGFVGHRRPMVELDGFQPSSVTPIRTAPHLVSDTHGRLWTVYGGHLWSSDNWGIGWTIEHRDVVQAFFGGGSNGFVVSVDGRVTLVTRRGEILQTDGHGQALRLVSQLPFHEPGQQGDSMAFMAASSDGSQIWVSEGSRVFASQDAGVSWSECRPSGIPRDGGYFQLRGVIDHPAKLIWATVRREPFLSEDGCQWRAAPPNWMSMVTGPEMTDDWRLVRSGADYIL